MDSARIIDDAIRELEEHLVASVRAVELATTDQLDLALREVESAARALRQLWSLQDTLGKAA